MSNTPSTPAGANAGIITRSEALAAGMTASAIAHRIAANGRWQRILPGIYLTHTGRPSASERLCAALQYGGAESIIGGLTACQLHGLRAAPRGMVIQILLPHRIHRSSAGFVSVRRTHLMPRAVRMNGLRVAPIARAVIDGCRELHDPGAVRALVAEPVQRGRASVTALMNEVGRGSSAGSALSPTVLAEVVDGVRSAAEAEARRAILRARLPAPVWNCDLVAADGRWIARPDAYWDEAGVVLEIDSQEWHLGAEQWKETMRRHSRMTSYGILVMHVPPSRVRDERAAVISELKAMLAAGLARGGAPDVHVRRRMS